MSTGVRLRRTWCPSERALRGLVTNTWRIEDGPYRRDVLGDTRCALLTRQCPQEVPGAGTTSASPGLGQGRFHFLHARSSSPSAALTGSQSVRGHLAPTKFHLSSHFVVLSALGTHWGCEAMWRGQNRAGGQVLGSLSHLLLTSMAWRNDVTSLCLAPY